MFSDVVLLPNGGTDLLVFTIVLLLDVVDVSTHLHLFAVVQLPDGVEVGTDLHVFQVVYVLPN